MRRAWAFVSLLGITTIWGATFPVVKAALNFASVGVFLVLRFFLAFLVLLVFGRQRARYTWPAIRCGLALFAGYSLQTLGLATTLPSRSAFITSISVVLVPLLQALSIRRAPGLRVWTAAALALMGLALLLQPEAGPLTWGDVLTMGCAVAFAAHVLALSQAVELQSPAAVNLVQLGVVAVLSPALLATEEVVIRPSPVLIGALAVTGIVASALAFFAMAKTLTVLTPAEVGVGLAFEPVAAYGLSVLLGLEPLTWVGAVGGALVVAGMILVGQRPS